ncbi:L-threonylcarbamoyladenylate synthase [Reinekea sp. G2M2-21]|uniref:L-threonylcarbamoyladenylate synthase n=1 Tax=Reinekea sp. G2M2-21 TaxID=2788942 RepID=UPI0018AA5D9D|nr:L-threonylcarbamoyladenylate synthase [Reinekea sp. G2M2-21]
MKYSQSSRVAASIVMDGGVIAYPTEGVFGLGCDPFNADAVGRILAIKKRPVDKGLIIIAHNVAQIRPYLAALSDSQWQTLEASWPGPNTWVIPHNGSLPDWVTGGRPTIAVRVTAHPVAAALCAALPFPLVSTSANRSGRPALHNRLQVQQQMADEVDFVVGGRVQTPGQASQITDLLTGQHFRL